jgi:hypothetical protein
VRHPELGRECWETDKQRGVQQAFQPKQRMSDAAANDPEPEPHDQDGRVHGPRTINDRLSVHLRSRSVRKPQPHPNTILGQMNLPSSEQTDGHHHAPSELLYRRPWGGR